MSKYNVKIAVPVDYIDGHLRYGHIEKTLVLTKEQISELEKNPKDFFNDELYEELCDFDEIIADDYEIHDYGEFMLNDTEILEKVEIPEE